MKGPYRIDRGSRAWRNGTGSLSGRSSATGTLVIDFADPGRHNVTIADVSGKRVCARAYAGEIRAEIPGLRRGIYYVRIESGTGRKVGIL